MLSPNRLWSVLFFSLFLLLTGCNSHKSGSSTTAPEALPGTETVYGVAATGAAVRGTVTLKDLGDLASPEMSTHTDTGDFNFNVSGHRGPFLLRVVSDDGQIRLLSFVHKGAANTRANINPLSNLITLYAGIGVDTRMQDPAYLYANAQLLATLNQNAVSSARQLVMSQRSTRFRELLAQQGLETQIIDPIRDAFEIGKGLDKVLDGVAFAYDPQTSEATEFDATTHVPINGGILTLLREELVAVHVADAPELMAQETSTQLRLLGTWKDGSIKPLASGVVWRVSDSGLAELNPSGRLTTHRLPETSSRTVWVTASYVVNGKNYSDEISIDVSPRAVLQQVRMHIEGLPNTMNRRPDGVIELDAVGTYFVQGKLLWHDGTSSFADWKTLYVQDGESAVEGVYSLGGWPWPWQTSSRALTTFKPAVDTELTLRGEVVVNGQSYVLSQRVVLKPFVRKAVGLELSCDATAILPGDAVSCTTSLRFNDDSRETVEAALSLPGVGEADAQVVGGKVQSTWAETASAKDIQVKATYGDFSATTPLRLLAKGNRVLSLAITGVSELNEGATANLQAWANWSDGTRTDVTGQVSWSLKPTKYAAMPYGGGQLKAGYILDGSSDQVLSVAATLCPQPNSGSCYQLKSVSAAADITLKYRNPMLVDVRITTPAFVAENSSLTLAGEAVWNKKKADGTSFTAALDAAAQWSAEGATVSVQGSTLTVGGEPAEPLVWLGVSYTDPYDAQVTRSAQTVLTIRKPLQNASVALGAGSLTDAEGILYSLETTGWSTLDEVRKTIRQRYLSAIRQEVAGYYFGGGRYFLRDDGSVWREQAVSNLIDSELSPKLRGAILSDERLPNEVPRRLSVAPATTALAYLDSYYSPYLQNSIYGLGADGRVWHLNTYSPTTVTYESAVSNVVKLTGSSQSIVALTKAGTVWVAGNNECGTLAQGHFNSSYPRSNFVQAKTSSGELTGIVDVAVSDNAVLALDSQGYLWTWGCNGYGALGQGDTTNRAYATRIESVSGFVAPLSNVKAQNEYYGNPPSFLALRRIGNEASVWGWGSYVLVPQMVAGSEGAVAPSGAGAYVLKGDGSLHRVLPPSSGAAQWGLQALWTRSADGARIPFVVSR